MPKPASISAQVLCSGLGAVSTWVLRMEAGSVPARSSVKAMPGIVFDVPATSPVAVNRECSETPGRCSLRRCQWR